MRSDANANSLASFTSSDKSIYSPTILTMNSELLRKDQLYFADKRDKDGASELYSVNEFSTRTTENIRKGYLVGKYGATPDIEIEEVE